MRCLGQRCQAYEITLQLNGDSTYANRVFKQIAESYSIATAGLAGSIITLVSDIPGIYAFPLLRGEKATETVPPTRFKGRRYR